jgi:hypothetical protein
MAGEPDSAIDVRPRPDVPEVMRAAVLFGPRDMRVVDRRHGDLLRQGAAR